MHTPDGDVFTTEEVLKVVRFLEENNVPPATCLDCGAACYVFVPPGVVVPALQTICDDCAAERGGGIEVG